MPIIALFSLTSLCSALILFSAQPFIAKAILPLYGGSPAVWNTAMVFFQGCLLAGYALAHLGLRHLGWKRLGLINLSLALLTAAWLLPPLPALAPPATDLHPTLSLLRLLITSMGLPFLLVCCNAPLLQYWFAQSHHPQRDNPYFLYAASNLGSLLALLAYPWLIEPALTVKAQSLLWSTGFALLFILMALCLTLIWRTHRLHPPHPDSIATTVDKQSAPPSSRLTWLIQAALPSALLLAITNHISTDIAAIPLLWVLPLAIYLLTFVIAFSRASTNLSIPLLATMAAMFAMLALSLSLLPRLTDFRLQITLNLGLLFFAALTCHLRLARSAPPTRWLTTFYLYLSLGGLIGGALISLVAPVVFDRVHEYPLSMVCLLLALPAFPRQASQRFLPLLLVLTLICLTCIAWSTTTLDLTTGFLLLILFTLTLLMISLAGQTRLQAMLLAISTGVGMLSLDRDAVAFTGRSFYGAYQVKDDADGFRRLKHGTTMHGGQSRAVGLRQMPTTYYHPATPIGAAMQAVQAEHPNGMQTAIVGLGTGAMACHARSDDHMAFLEIDPLMVEIASSPALFTYLRDCPGQRRLVVGDARLTLAREPDGAFDLLLLDAFTSDAIPVHIMTAEALALYRRKIRPDGLIAYHISNQYLDLRPVVDGLARGQGMEAWISTCSIAKDSPAARQHASSAVVAVLASPGHIPGDIRRSACWQPLRTPQPQRWTDDYSNLWSVMQ